MSETKDSADLERVLRDIADGSGIKPRDKVLAAVSLRILTDPPSKLPRKKGRRGSVRSASYGATGRGRARLVSTA